MKKNSFRTRFSHKEGSYDRLKSQLESENAMLLKQRKRLQTRSNLNVYQNPNTPNPVIQEQSGFSSYGSPQRQDKNNSKIEAICSKISQIIDICSQNQNLNQIANAEKRILSYLTTPFRSPERTSFNQYPARFSHEVKSKTSNKKQMREQINKKGYQISDEIMQIIQNIERKALIQIENLRIDKITLLQKLNEEIKNHNQLQRKSYVSQNRRRSLKQQNAISREKISGSQNALEDIQEVEEQHLQSSARERHNKNFQRNQKRISQPIKKERLSKNQQRSPTFSRHMHKNSQGQSSKSIRGRAPGQLIQSLEFNQDFRPPFPSPMIVNSELEIEKQINNLRQQNLKIRNAISQQQLSSASPLKSNLRNELQFLKQKALNYENILSNKNNIIQAEHSYQNNEELETLFLQGSSLIEQGRRLMKVKSDPNLRKNEGHSRWNFNQYESKVYSNPLLLY